MDRQFKTSILAVLLLTNALWAGDVSVQIEHNSNDDATPAWKFPSLPYPSKADGGQRAVFSILAGERDGNGATLGALNDGVVASEEDEPSASFFFRAGTKGGRLLADLGKVTEIQRLATYSWHPGSRGPQVYHLFASDGRATAFEQKPAEGADPLTRGWTLLASIDTRSASSQPGGQYAVNISRSNAPLGSFQYLLFEVANTETDDAFGHTFYSEIDIVERGVPDPNEAPGSSLTLIRDVIEIEGGYRLTLDTSETPELTDWARQKLLPMAKEWYPKLVAMLPSEGYSAPRQVSVQFRKDMNGVAATSGTRVSCAAKWFKANLEGEAVGAVFHELVHVVQQYGNRRREPGAARPPGWLVEGIADYVRWFQFEPQSRGAEITSRNLSRARYDGNYRISANFLNWVCEKHDSELVKKLNAAIREGKYREDLWKSYTGLTLQELGDQWKEAMEKKVASESSSSS